MNKTTDAWHYSRKATFGCMQIFFCVMHFLQNTCNCYNAVKPFNYPLAIHPLATVYQISVKVLGMFYHDIYKNV